MSTSPTPSGSAPGAPAAKSGVSAKAVIAIILVVVALVFVFSNSASAILHFLMGTLRMPAWIWFLVVLLVGVVVGSLFP